MTRKNVITYTVVALLFGAIGAWLGLQKTPAPATPPPPVAAKALSPVESLFSQSLPEASGASHSLARWKGKPLVVNFWAPWCAPCVQEMPELNDLAIAGAAKNINVIGIGIDTAANIAEFATRLRISYPLYVAGMSGTELGLQFGNTGGGLPYTVLIGADGKVKKTYLGKLKFEELKADLANLKR